MVKYNELCARCHVQSHFFSDIAVAKFFPCLIRLHTVQSIVDMVHQYHRTFVISSAYLRTRGFTYSNGLIKEELRCCTRCRSLRYCTKYVGIVFLPTKPRQSDRYVEASPRRNAPMFCRDTSSWKRCYAASGRNYSP